MDQHASELELTPVEIYVTRMLIGRYETIHFIALNFFNSLKAKDCLILYDNFFHIKRIIRYLPLAVPLAHRFTIR